MTEGPKKSQGRITIKVEDNGNLAKMRRLKEKFADLEVSPSRSALSALAAVEAANRPIQIQMPKADTRAVEASIATAEAIRALLDNALEVAERERESAESLAVRDRKMLFWTRAAAVLALLSMIVTIAVAVA